MNINSLAEKIAETRSGFDHKKLGEHKTLNTKELEEAVLNKAALHCANNSDEAILPEEIKTADGWEKYAEAYPKAFSTLTTLKQEFESLKAFAHSISKKIDSILGTVNVEFSRVPKEVKNGNKLWNQARSEAKNFAKEGKLFKLDINQFKALFND